ncbi:hypothetical protein RRG08_065682 [Elysia crispata]|uniref:Uncharacterized protein n=1 Tax=Elysia crispata TaxID=231223 RepID=A0AAE0Y4E7_9GAST|nr:hypothetical protein RRG08_065682 [Elysia crispata]
MVGRVSLRLTRSDSKSASYQTSPSLVSLTIERAPVSSRKYPEVIVYGIYIATTHATPLGAYDTLTQDHGGVGSIPRLLAVLDQNLRYSGKPRSPCPIDLDKVNPPGQFTVNTPLLLS